MLGYLTPSVDKWHQSCGKGSCFGDRLPVSPKRVMALWNDVYQYLASRRPAGIDMCVALESDLLGSLVSPAPPQSVRLALGTAAGATAPMSSAQRSCPATAMGN